MRTVLIDLPLKCKGYIYEDCSTGEQCCVLNARLNHESNINTYKHELKHVKNGDLHCSEDVNKVEMCCHKAE